MESKYGICFKGKLLRRLLLLKAMKPFEIAQYAKKHTVFYKRFYEGKDPSLFESLPVLKKSYVKEISPYELLSDELKKKVRLYGETTGSTGSPTPSFYTAKEFHSATLLTYISPYYPELKRILEENRTCINGLVFGFTIAGPSFGDLLANIGGLVANIGSRSTIATPERMARAIVRLEPSIITGAPIDFLSWMRIVKEDYPDRYDRVVNKLRAFLSTAELASDSRVKRIEEEFSITHINTYACVEGFFTLPCPCGEKHILPAYYVELFDNDLKKIGEKGTGRIAFTNLLKKSTPLIRYLLDDLVTIFDSRCPYGFTKSIIPHGRYELSVKINNELLNVEQFEEELFKYGLWGDYSIEIGENKAKIVVEDYSSKKDSIERLREGFKNRFGLDTEVNVVKFGEITAYREVRKAKPIFKLKDLRASSTQKVPEVI